MLGHQPLGDLPVLTHRSGPLGTEPFVTVRIDEDLTAQFVKLAHIFCHEGADAAGQDIHDGLFDLVLHNVLAAGRQGCHIVPDRLGGANVRHSQMEAAGILIDFLKLTVVLAGHMIF